MKNFLVRGFVVALALAGFTASTKAVTPIAKTSVSSMTVPACPPNDPNACGID